MQDCIFCKIAKGEIPAEKVAETKGALAFYDTNPSAELHVLIIPRKHINNFESVKKGDSDTISEMIKVTQSVIRKENPSKFRVIINGRNYLEVSHLHWHLQGGNLTKRAVEALINDSK